MRRFAPVSRVAAIDCGTNSIRLLVADVENGTVTDRVRDTRIVRLGAGVDRTGRLSDEGLRRTRDALRDYAAIIRAHDTTTVRMIATSATRDAQNRDVFLDLVHTELDVLPDIVTGLEEAALSFAGAASVLDAGDGALLVADIGGGSTELVRGDGATLQAHSMDVGCVRLTERHLADDPPTPPQVEAVVRDVRAALEDARRDVALDGPLTFVGVAGTVTTVTGMALGLSRYDSASIHGASISAEQIRDVTARLVGMTRDERTAVPVLHPGRVDVIVAGALVLRTLVDEAGFDTMIASEHDILDGIALDLAARAA